MRLKTDWVVQEPIDLEHKQYVFLDYASKVKKDLDKFKLYPSFQELALHVANINRIIENGEYITLNREPEEIDDEILLDDLIFNKLVVKDPDVFKEIVNIAKYAKEELTELFLIAKAIWTLLYDSVTVRVLYNGDKIKDSRPGLGFFFLVYNNKILIYQYNFKRLKKNNPENKCIVNLIYEGLYNDIDNFLDILNLIKQNHNVGPSKIWETPIDEIENTIPVFEVKYEQNFPLEGGILSIARRKVMNYIFQTIRIADLKED